MLIPQPPPEAIPIDPNVPNTASSILPNLTTPPVTPPELPHIQTDAPQIETDSAGKVEVQSAPELFHIACPNGHELETPREMLDQFAMCPTCNAQFQLLEKDSVEYQRRREIEDEARAANLERSWLNWAIALVILVLLGLGGLMLMSALGG